MTDFPSLSDLQKKPADDANKIGSSGLHVASGEVEQAFEKKMKSLDIRQKEIETMRTAVGSGFPHIDLDRFPISQAALRQLPKERAEQLGAVCFYFTQDEIRIGAINPAEPEIEDLLHELEERNSAHGSVYAISQKSFDRVFDLYRTLPIVKAITKDISISAEELKKVEATVTDFKSLQNLVNTRKTSDIVTYVMGAAFKLNASDVHVEAEEKKIVVRFRVDGILQDAAELPKEAFKKLISRIKLVSSLKINITEKPQDGRFTIKLEDGDVDVRVSTMPTIYGESVVMRLLKQSRKGLTLEELGLVGNDFAKLKIEIERPNGMVITTGPTGSGKTTSLYAIMQMLNKPGVKIITLEDPVEYRLEGLNQSQVETGKGYTFAKGLKSILRQDPDIAMVGEIRDLETASTAIQAALTGHLILSTIHTNSAAGAVPRFLAMGVQPFLLAPALNAIIGQRLVRKLDQEKKVPAKISALQMQRVEKIIASMPEEVRVKVEKMPKEFFTAPPDDGSGFGYKGRLGIYEILNMTPELEQMILSGKVSEFEIEKLAISQGMTTMVQDGIIKVLQGQTSLDEVFRVIE